jgi:hypothetical protein
VAQIVCCTRLNFIQMRQLEILELTGRASNLSETYFRSLDALGRTDNSSKKTEFYLPKGGQVLKVGCKRTAITCRLSEAG